MVLAALLSTAIGVSLGLLGGGGSILALPVLVYVAGVAPADAVGMSLAIVGATSVAASAAHTRSGQVDWRVALLFGASGIPGSLLGARWTHLLSGPSLLLLFAALMIVVGAWMGWRRRPPVVRSRARAVPLAAGFAVGLLTGFLGVGGGFVIVPALVAFTGLDMRRAVGTSLVVIALNSAAGYVGHLGHGAAHLGATLTFSLAAVLGALAGERLAGRVPAAYLRRTFAALVVLVGTFVAWRTLLGNA